MKMRKALLISLFTMILMLGISSLALAAPGNVTNLTVNYNSYDQGKLDISYTVNAYINSVTIQAKCGSSTTSLIPSVDRSPGSYTETVNISDIIGLTYSPSNVTFSLAYIIPANNKMEWVKTSFKCELPFEVVEYVLPNGLTIDVKANQLSFNDPLGSYLSSKFSITGNAKKIALSKLIGNQPAKVVNKLWGVASFFNQAASYSNKKHAWEVCSLCATSTKSLPSPETLNKDTFWQLLDQDLQLMRNRSLDDPNLTKEDIEYVMQMGPSFRQVWVLKGLEYCAALGNKGIALCY